MENAYIYTRVSTLIQVDGFSLEAQEAEIRAFAEARKINIVGKYTDEGKSGKNAEHRPAFTQMMEIFGARRTTFVMFLFLSFPVLPEIPVIPQSIFRNFQAMESVFWGSRTESTLQPLPAR